MIAYYIFLSIILFFIFISSLIYKGILFKHSKYRYLIKSEVCIEIIKKLFIFMCSFMLSIALVFVLTELLPNKSQLTSNNINSSNSNMLTKLLKYYYDILPFPKKICSSTSLINNNLSCTTYKYTLVNLGVSSSYMKNVEVLQIIKEKSLISFKFGIVAYLFQCLIGYPLGIYLAKHENKRIDKAFNIFHSIIRIIPPIIYFYIFLIIFMMFFKLPVLFDQSNLLSYIAPLSAITLSSSLYIAYFVRKYILLELDKDYIKLARSKGLSENTIFYKHAMKNAFIPFVRTIPSSILMCFSGFYMLEATFNIPGIGSSIIYAIQLKDVYLIRGLVLFFVFLSMLAHLIGDALTIILKRKKDLKKEVLQDD